MDMPPDIAGSSPPKPHAPLKRSRDESRAIESQPQTIHKVDLMDVYYGQWPSILINSNFKPSELWLIEVCAGAGTYFSSDHPLGFRRGCAIRACQHARDIQRDYQHVTMHVVLVEPEAAYISELRALVREFTEAQGRERVDVQILPSTFERSVSSVLEATRKPTGGYNFSLWFIDPDGLTQIPHSAILRLSKPARGPEVIVNLTASGMDRVIQATIPREGIIQHPTSLHDTRVLDRLFGNRTWRDIQREHRDIYLNRLVSAYSARFPDFHYRDSYPLNHNGREIRFLVQLANSGVALHAFRRTYESSLRVGLLQGAKTNEQQREQQSLAWFEVLRGSTTFVEDVYRLHGGRWTMAAIKVILQHADRVMKMGTFDGDKMSWSKERMIGATPRAVTDLKPSEVQLPLF